MSEPCEGLPPNGDISVKSSVRAINARYLSRSPRISAEFASADCRTSSAIGLSVPDAVSARPEPIVAPAISSDARPALGAASPERLEADMWNAPSLISHDAKPRLAASPGRKTGLQ